MALWDTMGHYEFGILTMAYYGKNLNLLMLYELLFRKSWLLVMKYPQAQCLLVDIVE